MRVWNNKLDKWSDLVWHYGWRIYIGAAVGGWTFDDGRVLSVGGGRHYLIDGGPGLELIAVLLGMAIGWFIAWGSHPEGGVLRWINVPMIVDGETHVYRHRVPPGMSVDEEMPIAQKAARHVAGRRYGPGGELLAELEDDR